VVRVFAQAGSVMKVRRLHAPSLPEEGGLVALNESASRHARVLRLRAGDEVELFDGRGRVAAAHIESVADEVVCRAARPVVTEMPGTRVVLMLAISKGSKLDDCVRMATELGVAEIALVRAERSVPRWDRERADSRIERLTRIAAEAAAQCERADIPIIHGPKSCEDHLAALPAKTHGIVFGARAQDALAIDETSEQVWCAVGPEGGFSDAELSSFEAAGFSAASLGPSVLRVDTAVAAGLAVIQERIRFLQAR
jgi:16S rRNA (uracil1498-N3)-methyltransferase